MQVTRILTDEDAVSPVLGVILMVAITVILAAVVAGFVFSQGNPSDPSPTVAFSYDYDVGDERLLITVQSGGSFTAQQVTFAGENLGDNEGKSWDQRDTDSFPQSVVNTGARANLSSGVPTDFELEIVWTAEDGGDSKILSTREGPDA